MLEQLDVLKWVCKELWNEAFKKSVDNLRTNHRGTYVLRDTQFQWTLRLSQNLVGQQQERQSPNQLAALYLVLPCAVIRGALAALGLDATVTADATTLPQCDFTIVVVTPPAPQVLPWYGVERWWRIVFKWINAPQRWLFNLNILQECLVIMLVFFLSFVSLFQRHCFQTRRGILTGGDVLHDKHANNSQSTYM